MGIIGAVYAVVMFALALIVGIVVGVQMESFAVFCYILLGGSFISVLCGALASLIKTLENISYYAFSINQQIGQFKKGKE